MSKDLKLKYFDYLKKYRVDDLFSPETKVLLILESPHKEEIQKGIPLVGKTGKIVSNMLSPFSSLPFGEIVNASKCKTIGIMNICQSPMQPSKATGLTFTEMESLKNKLEKGQISHLDGDEQELFQMIKKSFEKRLKNVANKCGGDLIYVVCGKVAAAFCNNYQNLGTFFYINHPSHGHWNCADDSYNYSIIKKIKSLLPVELIEKEHCNAHLKTMYSNCLASLKNQTDIWHKNSKKKVAACLYLDKKNDYITVQNIGISKVDGSSCAEKNAIITAVAKYPDIEMDEFQELFLLSENDTILPCGVCCEWLNKVNPNINLYTLYDNNFIRINFKNYYGDETEIERYLYQSSFY